MVRMRLMRGGTKRKPCYKIVVADVTSPRDGKFIEIVGRYHPLNAKEPVFVNTDRIKYWLTQGVQPTKVVTDILKKQGVKA